MRRSVDMLLFVALLCASSTTGAEPVEREFLGQVSGWHIEARDHGERQYNLGVRYIPRLSLTQWLNSDRFLDLEISLNAYAAANSCERFEDADLDLYRLKLRFATTQTETRLGLQRINFGPAHLLRPLRWFDRLDPTDPLQLTEGVWGLRFRYDTMNNASLWLWGLYGNEDPKGFEMLPTPEGKAELGGRLQLPLPRGEGAVSFHHRRVNGSAVGAPDFDENRLALDGRWDVEVGLWFETVVQQQICDQIPFEWTKVITLGMDYTLGIGNGIYILGEHMATASSEEVMGWDQDAHLWAFSANYPVGYLDNLSAIGFYSWEQKELRQYLAWQRTWDNWILNLSLFHYPASEDVELSYGGGIPISGYGGQVLVVFNH